MLVKLQEIFRSVFEDAAINLSEESSPQNIEDWDSFNHINLILEIEGAFDVSLTAPEVNSIKSVKDILLLLESKSVVSEAV